MDLTAQPTQEQIRYYAARHAWRLHRKGSRPTSAPTWLVWWQDRWGHGQTFDQYMQERIALRRGAGTHHNK